MGYSAGLPRPNYLPGNHLLVISGFKFTYFFSNVTITIKKNNGIPDRQSKKRKQGLRLKNLQVWVLGIIFFLQKDFSDLKHKKLVIKKDPL